MNISGIIAEERKIAGFDGYTVDNLGNVYSYKTGIKKKLSPLLTGHRGYAKVRLYYGSRNKRKDMFVHRIVALAFIPNPNNYPVVNHKDRNTLNNAVENLEWCTIEYNSAYMDAHKRSGEGVRRFYEKNPEARERVSKQHKGKKKSNEEIRKTADKLMKPIVAIKESKIVHTFDSAVDAENNLGIKRANICKVLKGSRKTAGGYEWKYAACAGELQSGGIPDGAEEVR